MRKNSDARLQIDFEIIIGKISFWWISFHCKNTGGPPLQLQWAHIYIWRDKACPMDPHSGSVEPGEYWLVLILRLISGYLHIHSFLWLRCEKEYAHLFYKSVVHWGTIKTFLYFPNTFPVPVNTHYVWWGSVFHVEHSLSFHLWQF